VRAPHCRLPHWRNLKCLTSRPRRVWLGKFLLERRLSTQPALRPLRTWKPTNKDDYFSLPQDPDYIERQAWASLGHAYTWGAWREAPTRERAEIVAHYLETNLRTNYEKEINQQRAEAKAKSDSATTSKHR
jgi:hypothetical protein